MRTYSKNSNGPFGLTAVKIRGGCSRRLRKILHPGMYQLNNWCRWKDGMLTYRGSEELTYEQTFYHEKGRVNIQAIVGMNGSGKSSLINVMLAVINNFSFWLMKDIKRPAAEELYWVCGLDAALYYVKDDELMCLNCTDTQIALQKGDGGETVISFDTHRQSRRNSMAQVIQYLEPLFYTVVTNYSMQSYISNDYQGEVGRYNYKQALVGESDGIWIDGLFHKNDGYMTPICINPYRNNGEIDLNIESDLTKQRLVALLMYFRGSGKQIIPGYDLDSIRFAYDRSWLDDKLSRAGVISGSYWNYEDILRRGDSIGRAVMQAYDIQADLNFGEVRTHLMMYAVYKLLSIVSKYPMFAEYKDMAQVKYIDRTFAEADIAEARFRQMLGEVKKDTSHVTLKLRQTINLIKAIDASKDESLFERPFTLDQYYDFLSITPRRMSSAYFEVMPPPVFKFDIYFRVSDSDSANDKPVPYSMLSSGQRQLLGTVTSIIYHARNILSIKSGARPRYRCINVVMDELEICFHPEMQRQFINYLLEVLHRLGLSQHISFNILIATHSPFVLSDIPRSNILFLEKGRTAEGADKFVNPFGANVNDLLAQSFFLSEGFVGDFAQKKVNNLVDELVGRNKKVNMDRRKIEKLIDDIGEPVIKERLLQFMKYEWQG